MSDGDERKSNGRGPAFAISGSYVINAFLLLALTYIWTQFQASEALGRKNEIRVVKLEAHHEHKTSDIADIKKDIKTILARSHTHGPHASTHRSTPRSMILPGTPRTLDETHTGIIAEEFRHRTN